MDDSALFEGAWMWTAIESHIDTVEISGTPEEFLSSLKTVPDYVQCLLPIYYCNYEICNGGFHQLFKNFTGVLFPEAISAYKTVGATSTAEVMETVLSMFGQNYPRDRSARHLTLSALEGTGEKREEWDPFYELDDKYYAEKNKEDLVVLSDEYAKQHHNFP